MLTLCSHVDCLQVATFDSSPSPVSCEIGSLDCHLSASRRSCEAPSEMDAISKQMACRSARTSIYESSEENDHNKSQKLCLLPAEHPAAAASSASNSRCPSPRPSICRARNQSAEREAIRIIIDDVDCDDRAPAASCTVHVGRLYKEAGKSSSVFAAFGLTLATAASANTLNTIITSIEPNASADRAGLRCGDVVILWDGVQVRFPFSFILRKLRIWSMSTFVQLNQLALAQDPVQVHFACFD